MSENDKDEKPLLLKAIELLLADPADIKRETENLLKKYRDQYKSKSADENKSKSANEINELVANQIISNYSYYAAFIGAATALTGVVPGLGTVIATYGGAIADAALTMKIQIEMIMAIATVYGHDIEIEEEKRLCMIIGGLGTINEAVKEGGKEVGKKAFIKMTQEYLKLGTLQAVKEIFKKVGITFTRKAVEKAIPFDVGVVIGFSANKGLTWYVGNKAKDFFAINDN